MKANESKELLRIVTSFRKGILGRKSPLKMCYVVCAPLSSYLKLGGYENELTEGEIRLNGQNKGLIIGHYWITLKDGRIIDPTASQFNKMGNEDMPLIYFGKKPKWYKLTNNQNESKENAGSK